VDIVFYVHQAVSMVPQMVYEKSVIHSTDRVVVLWEGL
jgi:hypothetical protein